jgi:DNA-binding CsgD family transcriptional regulator/DNA polymerase III delta prime subunit
MVGDTVPLVGRDEELWHLHDFVDQVHTDGRSLLLSGDPGVGKTVLLEATARYARAHGVRVLNASGVEFEAGVGFATLHQLLQPVFGEFDRLSDWHRDALTTALGLRRGPRLDQLVLSNAMLAVLEAAAASTPLLLVIDDLPWIDQASAAVLGFVARRLHQLPVRLLAASRTGEDNFLDRAGLPTRSITPLTDTAAHTLLETRYPAMAPRVRQRLLTEAQGNPLALLELPAALEQQAADRAGPLPAVLPLSRRLQSTFASRIQPLPARTRHLLLVAVLDGTGELSIMDAVADEPAADVLAPAQRARLVRVDPAQGRLVFRHPLIRSAVVELATADERRTVHRALAGHHSTDDSRRAWHLAEAATRPDEAVAALLQNVAHVNLWRGDSVGAIGELLRAAELSPAGPDRARRLAEAAYLGETTTGDLRDVGPLLDAARHADPRHAGGLAGAAARGYHLLHEKGEIDTAHHLLVRAIDALDDPTDAHNKVLVEVLHTLLMICYFGGRPELWESFHAKLGWLTPRPPERIALAGECLADPVHRALPVLDRLDAAIADAERETSPARIVRTGSAGLYVDRLPHYRDALWRAVEHGRVGGAVTSAIEGMLLLCADGWLTGDWDEVLSLSEETSALCEQHHYRLLDRMATYYRALVLAARGEHDEAHVLAGRLAAWGTPRQALSLTRAARHVEAVIAAGRGEFESAYQHAAAVTAPGELESHNPLALWVSLDLVEAAVRTGRREAAQAHARALTENGVGALSPRLAMVVAGVTAQATDTVAEFDRALETPNATRWPFDMARIQLTYGERLRRQRVTGDARRHLSAALDIFERLGAAEWANRAQSELRATGQPVAPDGRPDSSLLTPQQHEIATMAAAGLTNKQIGERLFLSHRTVATHLYQIFPKLGVASRAALRDALSAGNDPEPGDQ